MITKEDIKRVVRGPADLEERIEQLEAEIEKLKADLARAKEDHQYDKLVYENELKSIKK